MPSEIVIIGGGPGGNTAATYAARLGAHVTLIERDIVGGIAWGGGATLAGYFLGNVPFVHKNLELIILVILFVSLSPALVAAGRGYLARRRAANQDS